MVKQWVGAQLDGRIVAELDRQAEARGISRSEAMRRALERWLEEALEAEETRITRGEERHRQVMGRIDYLIGMQREMEKRLGIENKGLHRQQAGHRDDASGASDELTGAAKQASSEGQDDAGFFQEADEESRQEARSKLDRIRRGEDLES